MSYQGEFIKELVRRISVLEEEVELLRGEPANRKPGLGETYYYILHDGNVAEGCWGNTFLENNLLEFGNVFLVRGKARKKAKKIESVLKGEL